jgi:hypothetical protein
MALVISANIRIRFPSLVIYSTTSHDFATVPLYCKRTNKRIVSRKSSLTGLAEVNVLRAEVPNVAP